MPLDRLARVLGAVEDVRFDAGARLFARGDEARDLFLIASGTVRRVIPSGREVLLTASHCGEEAAAGISHYASTAIAASPVQAFRVPREALAGLSPTLAADAALALAAALTAEPLMPDRPERPGPAASARIGLKDRMGWMCAVLLPLGAGGAVFFSGAPIPTAVFAAIITVTIVLWMFTLVDEFIPPLVALVATLFTGLAPPSVALGGFASSTLMTLVGVFALSAVMSSSGLTYRAMLWMLRALPDRAAWQQAALLLGGYLMSPVTPSGNNRLSLMLPMYRDVVDGMRLPAGSPAATALMSATFLGAVLFSPMMATSKSSNLVALGMLPEQVQEEFLGLYWLAAALIAAVSCTLLSVLALRWLIPVENPAPLSKERLAAQLSLLGPMTAQERAALGGFVIFLGGAATVSWHHLSAAWIAGMVLVSLLASGVFTKIDFRRSLDWPMLFYLLGTDGLVNVMRHLDIHHALAAAASQHFSGMGGGLPAFMAVALVTVTVVRLALPITAAMLFCVVILLPVAHAQQVHPWICVFTTIMFSELWFLPYQSSQWLQALSAGVAREIDLKLFMRHNLAVNAARVAAVYASIPWWKWLGLA